jgi:hypothetical protein
MTPTNPTSRPRKANDQDDDIQVELEVRYIPLPPSKRADWDAAMQILTKMILQALELSQSNTEKMDREAEAPVALMPANNHEIGDDCPSSEWSIHSPHRAASSQRSGPDFRSDG